MAVHTNAPLGAIVVGMSKATAAASAMAKRLITVADDFAGTHDLLARFARGTKRTVTQRMCKLYPLPKGDKQFRPFVTAQKPGDDASRQVYRRWARQHVFAHVTRMHPALSRRERRQASRTLAAALHIASA